MISNGICTLLPPSNELTKACDGLTTTPSASGVTTMVPTGPSRVLTILRLTLLFVETAKLSGFNEMAAWISLASTSTWIGYRMLPASRDARVNRGKYDPALVVAVTTNEYVMVFPGPR